MSLLVANKVYRYLWTLFWRKSKIRHRLGPYSKHKV